MAATASANSLTSAFLPPQGFNGSSKSLQWRTQKKQFGRKAGSATITAKFDLIPPPYPMDALEPHMSSRTFEFHWGKHHRAYVDNLNKQIDGTELDGKTLEDIILVTYNNGAPLPAFNNAAQAWNHQFFWESMKPNGGGEPSGELLELINRDFGSYDTFVKEFKAAAATQFGSGWAWLAYKPEDKKLALVKTPNAETAPIYGAPYQANQMAGPSPPAVSAGAIQSPQAAGLAASSAQMAQHQLAYQHIHQQQQQQLQQQLQTFWANQYQEIEHVTDFKNHSLPLARIKKIMKADEDVRMISAEAPVVFARACEMFILELTLRAWNHTEENKRRTLQKNDIAAAITRTDIFDFLVDIVPREDLKDEVLATIPRGTLPVGGPTEGLPFYYGMPPQSAQPIGAPGMYMGKPVDQALYAQQPRPYMAQPIWPQQQQPPSDS